MKQVQFGCGGNRLDGWENWDSEVDISKPLPYVDESVDAILIEHCWEHIDPHAALRCLDECRRILTTGGVLRLCVPVIDRLEVNHARDIVFNHGHMATYSESAVYHLLRVAGFREIHPTSRKPCDGHFRVIGEEKDDIETLRVEAIK